MVVLIIHDFDNRFLFRAQCLSPGRSIPGFKGRRLQSFFEDRYRTLGWEVAIFLSFPSTNQNGTWHGSLFSGLAWSAARLRATLHTFIVCELPIEVKPGLTLWQARELRR